MRVVALLGPRVNQDLVSRFELPGCRIFSGNELDPGDHPDAALVFGGDGTMHYQLPALIECETPVLHVPCGSANDFPFSLGIRSVLQALTAWKRFLATGKNVRSIDVGAITPRGAAALAPAPATPLPYERHSGSNPANELSILGPRIMQSQLRHLAEAESHRAAQPAYFCCVASVGLDSEVTSRANRMTPWMRRHGGYVLALLRSLISYQPREVQLLLPAPEGTPSEDGWSVELKEPSLLLAIGNAPQYGAGMRIAHRAELDDGLLDVCFVRRTGKWKVLRFFPVVFRGEHIGMKEVDYRQVNRLRIETETPVAVYADGEFVCDTPVEVTIVPGALKVIVP